MASLVALKLLPESHVFELMNGRPAEKSERLQVRQCQSKTVVWHAVGLVV